MNIMTKDGWRLLGGPLSPAPAMKQWWRFPMAYSTGSPTQKDLEQRWNSRGPSKAEVST